MASKASHSTFDTIFLNLRELCREYGITMYTTRLCSDELVELRRKEFRDWIAAVEDVPQWVRDHLGNPAEVKLLRPKDVLLEQVEKAVLSMLSTHDIEIIANAQIPQDTLLEMAVRKTPPFKDKGRGYRDAVIFLTIIEHEHARIGQPGCLIVSADQDFQEARRLPHAQGLDLNVVPSAEEAIRFIRARMDALVKARLQEEEKRLMAFLNIHRDEIQDLIKRHAPSPRGVLMSSAGLGIFETVETIDAESIELVKLESAFAYPHPPADGTEAWVDLAVTASVRARATVDLSLGAQLALGGQGSQGYPRERLMETKAIISGSVLAKESQGRPEYAGVKLQQLRWESPLSEMLWKAYRSERED